MNHIEKLGVQREKSGSKMTSCMVGLLTGRRNNRPSKLKIMGGQPEKKLRGKKKTLSGGEPIEAGAID